MRVSIIAAIGKNRALGINNKIPWHLADDLKRFRELTTGHTVIMGRKTHESIGRPLPNRNNIVLTRTQNLEIPGCQIAHRLEDALKIASKDNEVFVIGGEEIYRQALPKADRLYITEVHASPKADTFFPEFDERNFELVWTGDHKADPRNDFDWIFKIYERRRKEN